MLMTRDLHFKSDKKALRGTCLLGHLAVSRVLSTTILRLLGMHLGFGVSAGEGLGFRVWGLLGDASKKFDKHLKETTMAAINKC